MPKRARTEEALRTLDEVTPALPETAQRRERKKRARGAGEGSIFEESPGKWVASITVGYAFKDGKRSRVRKKFSAPTRKEVQTKLAEALRSQHAGFDISPRRQTVGQFLNYWLEQVVPNASKPKTQGFYKYVVTAHLLPTIGEIPLQRLTPQNVQALLNDKLTSQLRAGRLQQLQDKKAAVEAEAAVDAAKGSGGRAKASAARIQQSIDGLKNRRLSPRSVRHIHRTLCTALETAVRYGAAPRNVARLVDPPRAPKPSMKFLTIDQARAVLAAAGDDPLYALYATILSLGLRLGEALGLSWDDVDFSAGRIRIRRALQRVKGGLTLLDPKTEGSTRSIDLPAITIAALREHRIRQLHAEEWAAGRWKGNEWNLVFTSAKGTPLDERNILRRFQNRILKGAGVPKMRIHDLRHSAVAILMAQGVDARSISELLGHSSIAFTLQVYGHLMEETRRETASKMDSALAPRNPLAPSLAPSAPRKTIN